MQVGFRFSIRLWSPRVCFRKTLLRKHIFTWQTWAGTFVPVDTCGVPDPAGIWFAALKEQVLPCRCVHEFPLPLVLYMLYATAASWVDVFFPTTGCFGSVQCPCSLQRESYTCKTFPSAAGRSTQVFLIALSHVLQRVCKLIAPISLFSVCTLFFPLGWVKRG